MRVAQTTWQPSEELAEPVGFFNRGGKGGGCEGGGCQNGQCQNGDNESQQYQTLGKLNPWPAGMDRESEDTASRLEGPIRKGFDRQAAALDNLANAIKTQQPAPTPTPAPPLPDPRVDQAIGLAGQANQKLDALIQAQAEKAKVEAEKPKLAAADEKMDTILHKLPQTKLVQAEEKALEDPADKIHKELFLVLGTLGLLFVIGSIVSLIMLIKSGHGLIGTAIDKAAAAKPNDAFLQSLKAQADGVDAKIAAALPKGIGLPGLAAGSANDVAQQVKDHLTALLTPAPGQAPLAPSPPTAPAAASPTTVS